MPHLADHVQRPHEEDFGVMIRSSGRAAARVLGGVILLAVVLAGLAITRECIQYIAVDAYFDHIESNVLITAWQYLSGVPLYAMEAGAPRLATYYGPLAYLGELPALLLFGPEIAASKLTSMAAVLITVSLMAVHFYRHSSPMQAAQGLLLLLAGLLVMSPISLWVRPDPLETLLVALGIVGAASPVLLGICIGLAVNLKVHAFIYFLPLVVELYFIRGWRVAPRLVASAGVAFLLPFLLPGVSLHDYVVALGRQVTGRGLAIETLPQVAAFFLMFLIPVALPLVQAPALRRDRVYGLAALASLSLLLYPATFPGAGAYHFLPLLPILADARRRLATMRISSVMAVVPLLIVAIQLAQSYSGLLDERRDGGSVAREALRLARESPVQPVQVGYGESRRSYEISQLSRANLTFHGYPSRVDAQVLMELRQIGIDGSARWLPLLTECRIARWLLPRNEAPFAVTSYFYDQQSLFSDEFRAAFTAHYRLTATSGDFDIWDCVDGRR